MPKSNVEVGERANYILKRVKLALDLKGIKNPSFEEKSDLKAWHARAINVALGLDKWDEYEKEYIEKAKKELDEN